jgi:hypothetical protein
VRLGATFSDEGGRKGWAGEVWRVEPREKGGPMEVGIAYGRMRWTVRG